MARGYPDWRPANATVSVLFASVNTSGAADIIAAPGAGFRILLFALWYSSGSAVVTGTQYEEQTAAGATVRSMGRLDLGGVGPTPQFQFFGMPFGENNKLRQIAVIGATVRINAVYAIEAVA